MRYRRRFARVFSKLKKSRKKMHVPGPSPDSPTDCNLLEGRTVLVTGGASNIGRGIAVESARQGANVVIVDIDDEALASLGKNMARYPGWTKGYHCDLSQNDAIDSLCETLQKENILVDVLANNVGVGNETRSVVDMDIGEWQKTFATNVFGPMYLTRCITRSMIKKQRTGSIIFITSIHQWTVRRDAAYSASKGALAMIVKELAVDLAPHGIRVNGIAPGWVAEDTEGDPLPQRAAVLHQSSIQPCYIGRAAVYLSADCYSFYTTGSVLKIDAGLSLSNHLVG
ncbi:MAG: SDR family oxidoreductase [Pseudomonadota bacterium]